MSNTGVIGILNESRWGSRKLFFKKGPNMFLNLIINRNLKGKPEEKGLIIQRDR